uniref:SCAN box domain-containing protein n=1 Tax=Gasterosteus aculeatus aculeatus TaxID=481459 RepID=A0AAQ4PJ37_GASAC
MEEILKTLIAGQQAQMQTNLALLEEQKKANFLKAEELQLQKQMADRNVRPINASNYLSKMGATDDVEAFLHAFEATATREAWPRDQWVGLLAPFLTGEALNAVRDLGPDQATDYDALKTEILSRNGITKFGMAQRFHNWTFQPDQPPRTQMHELVRITRKWLEPQRNTAPAVVEAVVVDRYLRALPYEAKQFLSQQALTTADLTVEAVEKYQATTDILRASRREPRSTALPQTGTTPRLPTQPLQEPQGEPETRWVQRKYTRKGKPDSVTGVGEWDTSPGSVGCRRTILCPWLSHPAHHPPPGLPRS